MRQLTRGSLPITGPLLAEASEGDDETPLDILSVDNRKVRAAQVARRKGERERAIGLFERVLAIEPPSEGVREAAREALTSTLSAFRAAARRP